MSSSLPTMPDEPVVPYIHASIFRWYPAFCYPDARIPGCVFCRMGGWK